jgi:predicted lipoprotein with Yx(FWY)xxD motif
MPHTIRNSRHAHVALLVAAAALVLAACGSAATPVPTSAPVATTAPSAAASVYTVKLAQDAKLGGYLTGEDGMALYLLTADKADTTTCTAACAGAWPPFELGPGETVAAGDGVTGSLATITRADDGKAQVTYNGIPLYYFAADKSAGDIKGQSVKGVWFLVAAGSTSQGGPIKGGVGQP